MKAGFCLRSHFSTGLSGFINESSLLYAETGILYARDIEPVKFMFIAK